MSETGVVSWGYGGGVQSVAIGVLIREGALPRPDLAAIADTGRERKTTWDYLDRVMAPHLAPVGVEIVRIPHSLATTDLYSGGDDLPLIPAFTRRIRVRETFWGPEEVTDAGRLRSFCPGTWKRDVMLRWLRAQGVKECESWIGFSVDERHRVGKDRAKWRRIRYPLIELGLTRNDCRKVIERAGLPVPHKSRCWCCPHQTDDEWAEVFGDEGERAMAVALDEQIRECDPDNGLYLHHSRTPLAIVQLGGKAEETARPCEGGTCWT